MNSPSSTIAAMSWASSPKPTPRAATPRNWKRRGAIWWGGSRVWTRGSGGPRAMFEFVRQPHLDQRLPSDAELPCLLVERFYHPSREIDIDALGQAVWAPGFGPIEMLAHIFAGVEFFVEVTGFHSVPLPLLALDGRKSGELVRSDR